MSLVLESHLKLDFFLGSDKAFHVDWDSILADPSRRSAWLSGVTKKIEKHQADLVVSVASRGHIFGLPAALTLNLPYAMIYKDRPFTSLSLTPTKICVVDDIICHGRTMNIVTPILQKAYPDAEIVHICAVYVSHDDNAYPKEAGLVEVPSAVEDGFVWKLSTAEDNPIPITVKAAGTPNLLTIV